MLTDEELEVIADQHQRWEKAKGGAGKTWQAHRLARQVPSLLAHIAELTAERDQAEVALQGTEQVA